MSASELRDALKRLHLSQAAAARFLGVTPRTMARYVMGTTPVPHAASKLLRLMVALRVDAAWVEGWVSE